MECVNCSPGTFAADAGALECDFCAAGTATADAGAASCGVCEAGTSANDAGFVVCTACGDCNDGESCTVDSCDPVRGCVHTVDPTACVDAGGMGGGGGGGGGTATGGGGSAAGGGGGEAMNPTGCGCTSTDAFMLNAMGLLLLALRRRVTIRRS